MAKHTTDQSVLTQDDETWKTIPGFEDYEASTLGRIRSVDRSHMTKIGANGTLVERKIKGVILKSCISKTGYPVVALTKNGIGYTKKVHRLVAQTFIGEQPEGMECRHLDGNRTNANLDNLAWGTHAENHADREIHDTLHEGESHYRTDLSEFDVVKIRTKFNLGETQNELAEEFNVARSTIGSIIQRKSWSKVAEFSCSYCPADDKLRIVATARFSDSIKNVIKNAGFRWASKQELWVSHWTPEREDLCFELAGFIGDEDTSPEERSIQRAERFAGYRDKRRSEAHGHADTYDSGPNVFGNQNAARAQRAADRHERHRGNALSQWAKAEYWQSRTAGVIGHALHKCDARTRRGRILAIEADLRRCTEGSRWHTHLTNRLAYENAMLANEGGTASEVEMIPGGFIGRHQILKVNRSPITKRVVSVNINASWGFVQVNSQRVYVDHGGVVNIERLGEDAYRVPTTEELEAFNGKKAAAPKKPGLINPTLEDAQRLQALWNKDSKKPGTVQQTTQERYTNRSKWSDCSYTTTLFSDGTAATYRGTIREWVAAGKTIVGKLRIDPVLCGVNSIVVLTDKPQKPLPISWPAPVIEQQEAPEQATALRDESDELEAVAAGRLF